MPAIQSQYSKWKDKGFVLLAANMGQNKLTVGDFADRHKLTFPILLDTKEEVRKSYNVTQYPTTVFLFIRTEKFTK